MSFAGKTEEIEQYVNKLDEKITTWRKKCDELANGEDKDALITKLRVTMDRKDVLQAFLMNIDMENSTKDEIDCALNKAFTQVREVWEATDRGPRSCYDEPYEKDPLTHYPARTIESLRKRFNEKTVMNLFSDVKPRAAQLIEELKAIAPEVAPQQEKEPLLTSYQYQKPTL